MISKLLASLFIPVTLVWCSASVFVVYHLHDVNGASGLAVFAIATGCLATIYQKHKESQ